MQSYKEIIADIEQPTTWQAAIAEAFNLSHEDVRYPNSYTTFSDIRKNHLEQFDAIIKAVDKYRRETYPALCEAKFKAALRAEVTLPDDIFERLYDYFENLVFCGYGEEVTMDYDDYAEEMRKLADVFGKGL